MNPFSAEYAQIQKVRADYPTFTVRTRSIKKNAAKDSYKGLTYDYMRAYIMSHEKGEDSGLFYRIAALTIKNPLI